jgi:hypothetical protein
MKINASVISGIAEVMTTYPIDYLKTIKQANKPMDIFWSNPYRGAMPRVMGLIPMRMVFWNSLYFCHNKNYSNLKTSVIASFAQTIIDYPTEQIKIQKMIHKRHINECLKINTLAPGFITTLGRNFGFLYIMNYFIVNGDDNNMLNSAVGGLVGSFVTHPLDTLKTHFQHNDSFKLPKFTFRQYFNGGLYRCSISIISMGIGWNVFNMIKDNTFEY